MCATCEGFAAELLHTVLPKALITLNANTLPSGFASLVCLGFFFEKRKAFEGLMEHLIALEPPEIHLSLPPFTCSECKLE